MVRNAYVAEASHRTQGRALGNLHGSYGVGAFASPLLCQTLLAVGWTWHQFYWLSLGFTLFNAVFIIATFRTTPGEFDFEKEAALELVGRVEMNAVNGQPTASALDLQAGAMPQGSKASPLLFLSPANMRNSDAHCSQDPIRLDLHGVPHVLHRKRNRDRWMDRNLSASRKGTVFRTVCKLADLF